MFHDPREFPFTARLEAAVAEIRAEVLALGPGAFEPSPDSLTEVDGVHDERGWLYAELVGSDREACTARRRACPRTARLLEGVEGLRNAGFSLFRPGTHLYPHRGELEGVLRCHLPLVVPAGDVGLRVGARRIRWRPGRALVFDDRVEHEAWNHGKGERIVLLVTFDPRRARRASAGGAGAASNEPGRPRPARG